MTRNRKSVSLRRWNTFGVECVAEHAAHDTSVASLQEVLERFAGMPLTIFGGGSNVILRKRLPGYALRVDIPGISAERRDGNVYVTAGAGVCWHDLVRYCIGQGFYGIENLALIPGRVGAAPMQNIGAYGVELAQVFAWLDATSIVTGEQLRFDRDACGFGYRESVFKHRADVVVTAATLRLSEVWQPRDDYPDVADMLVRLGGAPSAARVAEAVIRVRRRKLPDPRRIGNAGSMFKNPVVSRAAFDALGDKVPRLSGFEVTEGMKVPAARLIEHCGWKGRRVGAVGVWHRQPLVLVNHGDATGADVLAVAELIRADVADRLGVSLELEPRVLGVD